MKQFYDQIKQQLKQDEPEMIELLKRIVNIDSGTKNVAGVQQVVNLLKEKMTEFGYNSYQVDLQGAGPILVGEFNQQYEEAPLLYIGHTDTVFPDGKALENPFRVDEVGKAYGPGVLDMKGGLVIALYALKAVSRIESFKLPVKLIFLSDEENLHMNSNAREVFTEMIQGAKACFNFETGSIEDGLVTSRKGGGIIDIHIKGFPAHSGADPEKGRSAILEMAQKILALEAKNDFARGKMLNCGIVSGGSGENVIPEDAKISIGMRFSTVAIQDELLADIEKIVNTSFVEGTKSTMKVKMLMDCMEPTEGVMALYQLIEDTASECGYGKVQSIGVSGVSDSGITVTQGIPTVCSMGIKGEHSHSDLEYGLVDSLVERAYLAACASLKITNK